MCMPLLVITLAVDGSEWSASALPPTPIENVHLEALCPVVSLHALEKRTLTCPSLKTVEVRNPLEGLIV